MLAIHPDNDKVSARRPSMERILVDADTLGRSTRLRGEWCTRLICWYWKSAHHRSYYFRLEAMKLDVVASPQIRSLRYHLVNGAMALRDRTLSAPFTERKDVL